MEGGGECVKRGENSFLADFLTSPVTSALLFEKESYFAVEKALRALSQFYSTKGPRARLPEDVRDTILGLLQEAEDGVQ